MSWLHIVHPPRSSYTNYRNKIRANGKDRIILGPGYTGMSDFSINSQVLLFINHQLDTQSSRQNVLGEARSLIHNFNITRILKIVLRIKRILQAKVGWCFCYAGVNKIRILTVEPVRWTHYSGSSSPAIPHAAISPLIEKPARDFAEGVDCCAKGGIFDDDFERVYWFRMQKTEIWVFFYWARLQGRHKKEYWWPMFHIISGWCPVCWKQFTNTYIPNRPRRWRRGRDLASR